MYTVIRVILNVSANRSRGVKINKYTDRLAVMTVMMLMMFVDETRTTTTSYSVRG